MIAIKKLLLTLLALAIVIGAGIAYYASTQLDARIAREIEAQGSAALGTKVTVAGVETKLRDGTATVSGLTVANSDGYTQDNALEFGQFSATVDYASREIKEIIIDSPTVNAELIGAESNFQKLLRNIPERAEEEDAANNEEELEFTIRRLAINNAVLNVSAKDTELEDQSFTMADLVINNVNGTSKQIATELAHRVSAHITSQIKAHAAKLIRDRATQEFKEEANKLGSRLLDRLQDRDEEGDDRPVEEP